MTQIGSELDLWFDTGSFGAGLEPFFTGRSWSDR
jgi:hypothetical protein